MSGSYDIAFAFDTSKSLSQDAFLRMKTLASYLIGGYQISPAKTRLSFITFGDSVEQALTFADSADVQTVKRYLDRLTRMKGDLNLDLFLEYVVSTAFNPSRVNVGRALVIFTMKSSQNDINDKDRSTLANRLLKRGIKLVVVGIDLTTNDVSGLKAFTENSKDLIPVPNIGLLMEKFGAIERKIVDAVGKSLFDKWFIYIFLTFANIFVVFKSKNF